VNLRRKTNKAYRLYQDITHLGPETEEDAWVLNFPNNPSTGFYSTQFFDFFPNPIEFGAIGSLLSKTDYPYTDIGWLIMSKRMLETLLSVGYFPHRTYPVLMIDQVIDLTSKELKFMIMYSFSQVNT
jgi:hypothetical protein